MMKITLKLLISLSVLILLSSGTPDKSDNIYSTAPEGAIVLFDGSDFSKWTNCDGEDVQWKIVNGVMAAVPDSNYGCERIQGTMTKRHFKDFQLHVEFKLPDNENTNSGVYIQKRYEIQINYSHDVDPSRSMGGSIYRMKAPDAIAGKPRGEWETYDIIFRSPRFDESTTPPKKVKDARITVIHNDVVIHNNVIVPRKTGVGFPEGPEPGPIMLQDHHALVQFRNIWIIPNTPEEALQKGKN